MSKPRDGGAGGGADRGADRRASGRQVDERICSYVDGCLAPREQDRFVAELRVNPQLQKDLEEYQRTVAAVREALQAPTVPTRLADRVMAAIGTPAAPPRRAPARTWQSLVWSVAAAAALLALSLWLNAWEGGPSRMTVAQAPALDSLALDRSSTPVGLAPRPEDKAAEPVVTELAERLQADRDALPPAEPEPLVRKVDSGVPAWGAIPSDAGGPGVPPPPTSLAGARESNESKEKFEQIELSAAKDKAAAAAKNDSGVPLAEARDDPATRTVTRLVAPATPVADGAKTGVPTPDPASPAVAEAERELPEAAVAEPSPRDDRRFAGGPVAGGGGRGGGGRGAPAGRAASTEPVGTIPLVVFTADAKQLAAVQARGRSADATTGSDDFYLGSTRKAGAAGEEVPQLFGFLLQQFPGPDAGSLAGLAAMSITPPQQPGAAGSAGGRGAAKSAPSAGPVAPGPSSPGPGAPSAGASPQLELQSLAAGLPAPVFSRWQSLRFEALTAVPTADDVAGAGKERTAAPSTSPEVLGGGQNEADREKAATAERTWLVEGRRTEVAELLGRLAALARVSGFQVRNGELPADAAVLSARLRLPAQAAPPADVTAAPAVPPSPATPGGPGGPSGPSGPDRDVMRIVLRFQTR